MKVVDRLALLASAFRAAAASSTDAKFGLGQLTRALLGFSYATRRQIDLKKLARQRKNWRAHQSTREITRRRVEGEVFGFSQHEWRDDIKRQGGGLFRRGPIRRAYNEQRKLDKYEQKAFRIGLRFAERMGRRPVGRMPIVRSV